jgi:hypothetical protein
LAVEIFPTEKYNRLGLPGFSFSKFIYKGQGLFPCPLISVSFLHYTLTEKPPFLTGLMLG